MAKRFFYVGAGLLCVIVTYHLGAHAAGATKSVPVEGASIFNSSGLHYSALVNRRFCLDGQSPAFAPPIPGTDHVIATDPTFLVMLENGDVLQLQGSTTASWVKIGNVCASQ